MTRSFCDGHENCGGAMRFKTQYAGVMKDPRRPPHVRRSAPSSIYPHRDAREWTRVFAFSHSDSIDMYTRGLDARTKMKGPPQVLDFCTRG